MNPVVKYTLGRVGIFAVVLAALSPVPLDVFVKLMVALLASAGFSLILLRGWRDEMAEHLAAVARRRSTEKSRLRAALAGDDTPAEDTPTEGTPASM